jgi:hypothetical protein
MSGRKYNGPANQRTFAIGPAAAAFLPADSNRNALTLSAADADIWVGLDATVAVGSGLRIVNGTAPFNLCGCHGGWWVNKQLFAITAAGIHNITVIESFFGPDGEDQ